MQRYKLYGGMSLGSLRREAISACIRANKILKDLDKHRLGKHEEIFKKRAKWNLESTKAHKAWIDTLLSIEDGYVHEPTDSGWVSLPEDLFSHADTSSDSYRVGGSRNVDIMSSGDKAKLLQMLATEQDGANVNLYVWWEIHYRNPLHFIPPSSHVSKEEPYILYRDHCNDPTTREDAKKWLRKHGVIQTSRRLLPNPASPRAGAGYPEWIMEFFYSLLGS